MQSKNLCKISKKDFKNLKLYQETKCKNNGNDCLSHKFFCQISVKFFLWFGTTLRKFTILMFFYSRFLLYGSLSNVSRVLFVSQIMTKFPFFLVSNTFSGSIESRASTFSRSLAHFCFLTSFLVRGFFVCLAAFFLTTVQPS